MRSGIIIGSLFASLAGIVAACSAPATSEGEGGGRGGGVAREPASSGTENARGPSSAATTEAEPAKLRVHLVDAPAQEVSAIVVTIAKIEASINGEWLTVSDSEHTVDLLTLQHGAFLYFGETSLPPGHVEQVRLVLTDGGDHHVVAVDGQSYPLVVPSGEASGIKLVGGFDLAPCSTAQLTLDFDGKRSLRRTGGPASTDGKWMLQPVIRILALVAGGSCEDAGATDADADGGSAMLEDTCADVTCPETELCENGTCRAAE